jgi:hypothetical protein
MMQKGMLALLFVCAAGCTDPEPPPPPATTAGLAPSQIRLAVELRSNGGLAQVFVELRRGDFVALELGGGDALFFAPVGGDEQELTKFDYRYIGQTITAATDFEVVFARGAERFVATVELPLPFALSAPVGPVSRAQPITVTWDNVGDTYDTRLEVGGECLTYPIGRILETDPGTYDVQPADLAVKPDAVGCDLAVEVTRHASQDDVAPDFSPESFASASQIRTIFIATEP